MREMKPFAKIFGSDWKQILVKLDANEDGLPEVRVYFQPEQLGVCAVALAWDDDTDKSWDLAEAAFEKMDQSRAEKLVEEQISGLLAK